MDLYKILPSYQALYELTRGKIVQIAVYDKLNHKHDNWKNAKLIGNDFVIDYNGSWVKFDRLPCFLESAFRIKK